MRMASISEALPGSAMYGSQSASSDETNDVPTKLDTIVERHDAQARTKIEQQPDGRKLSEVLFTDLEEKDNPLNQK